MGNETVRFEYRKYPNDYEKIKTLVAIVSSPANQLYNNARADTVPVVLPDEDDESVFNYFDAALGPALFC